MLLGIGPNILEYAIRTQGLRGTQILDQGRIATAESGKEPWNDVVEELSVILKKTAVKKTNCRVVLSNRFVRCQHLAWTDELKSAADYETLARARFRSVHGAVTDSWYVRLGGMRFGKSMLACAVDSALTNAIEDKIVQSGNRLTSIEPNFSAAFDRYRSEFKDSSGWFASIEPGRLWLGKIQDGQWQCVSSRVLGAGTVSEVLRAVSQEMTLNGAGEGLSGESVQAVASGITREEIHALRDAGIRIAGFISGNFFDLCGVSGKRA
jgi:hypothetical protein